MKVGARNDHQICSHHIRINHDLKDIPMKSICNHMTNNILKIYPLVLATIINLILWTYNSHTAKVEKKTHMLMNFISRNI